MLTEQSLGTKSGIPQVHNHVSHMEQTGADTSPFVCMTVLSGICNVNTFNRSIVFLCLFPQLQKALGYVLNLYKHLCLSFSPI